MFDEPVRGATPANADNLSATSKRPASEAEEPIMFMTPLVLKAMLRERRKRPLHRQFACSEASLRYRGPSKDLFSGVCYFTEV